MFEVGFVDDDVALLVEFSDNRCLGLEVGKVVRLFKTEFSSLLVSVFIDMMWTFYLMLVMFL